MKINKELALFLFAWSLFQISLGWLDYLHFPPFGMHQGAQSDRACIAYNYYAESWNFFLPRVMEDRSSDGIVGLEFPIIPYISAIFYKIFGFHNQIYRMIVGVIVFFGHFATWKIITRFIDNNIHRFSIMCLWTLSPIMCFYSFNYLPDMPSMAFIMISYSFFFKFYFDNKPKYYYLFLLFVGMGSLIKITNLIHLISIWLIYSYKKTTNHPNLNLPKTPLWLTLIPLVIVLIWYKYANFLTQSTNNYHFLQSMVPPTNFSEIIENSRFAINTWIDSLYPRLFISITLIVYILTIIRSLKKITLIGILSIITFLGYLSVFILFNKQFKYHDYYQTLFYPIFLFILIWVYQQINSIVTTSLKPIIKHGFTLVLLITAGINYSHSRNMLNARFDFGNYYCQNALNIEPNEFKKLKLWLEQNITNNNQVVFAFDPSPNTALYHIKRKGIRIAPDFTDQLSIDIIRDKLQKNKVAKLLFICNDTVSLNKLPNLKAVLGKPIQKVSMFYIYKYPN